jgi:hypothetical protein
MVTVIRFLQRNLKEHQALCKVLGALSLGALLGTLAAVPYDQLLGLARPPCTIPVGTAVQSLIATATLFRVWAVDRAELVLKI